MGYILALALLCVAYGVCIGCMKYMRNTKLFNLLFMALVYLQYLALAWVIYQDVGFWDWNFQNTLPMANVSPFMFSLMPLLLILPEKIRQQLHLLISMLSVGMLLSSVLGCISNAMTHYKFHAHFLLDFGAHFALSAFGVYLVKSGQVKINWKNCLRSGAWIYGAAVCMLVLNVIFDKSFFGLSLNGKHNIYNKMLVESSYLSALIYFVGLGLVMLLGAGYCKMMARKTTSARRG